MNALAKDNEAPMTDEDRAFVRELLIEAGYSQERATWMAASCPSIGRVRWLIGQDRARGVLP